MRLLVNQAFSWFHRPFPRRQQPVPAGPREVLPSGNVQLSVMSKASVERRLRQVAGRLRELREELGVSDEQLTHLADAADDARLRALVSETPVAGEDHRQAERHAEAMRRHRAKVLEEISRLERSQDELLDRLVAESRR